MLFSLKPRYESKVVAVKQTTKINLENLLNSHTKDSSNEILNTISHITKQTKSVESKKEKKHKESKTDFDYLLRSNTVLR